MSALTVQVTFGKFLPASSPAQLTDDASRIAPEGSK